MIWAKIDNPITIILWRLKIKIYWLFPVKSLNIIYRRKEQVFILLGLGLCDLFLINKQASFGILLRFGFCALSTTFYKKKARWI